MLPREGTPWSGSGAGGTSGHTATAATGSHAVTLTGILGRSAPREASDRKLDYGAAQR